MPMHGFVAIDQEVIAQAIDQIKQHHLKRYGKHPDSLVWAIAFEDLAAEIRKKLSVDQIRQAGLDLEIPALSELNAG